MRIEPNDQFDALLLNLESLRVIMLKMLSTAAEEEKSHKGTL